MSSLAAEIKDLSSYLAGLPRELLESGAFSSYEARLNELKTEFAAAKLQQLAGVSDQPVPASFDEAVRVFQERAGTIESQVRREERRHLNLALFLDVGFSLGAVSVGLVAASAGSYFLAVIASLAACLAVGKLVLGMRSRSDPVFALRIHLLRAELGRHKRRPISPEEAAELSRRIFPLLEDFPGSESPRGI